jgi:hypothetical protein
MTDLTRADVRGRIKEEGMNIRMKRNKNIIRHKLIKGEETKQSSNKGGGIFKRKKRR